MCVAAMYFDRFDIFEYSLCAVEKLITLLTYSKNCGDFFQKEHCLVFVMRVKSIFFRVSITKTVNCTVFNKDKF